jgi:hypothetical protein
VSNAKVTYSSRHNRIIMSKKVMYAGRKTFIVCFKELLSAFFTKGTEGKHGISHVI